MDANNVPIYIIQGRLNANNRNLSLLVNILENNYKYPFIIKLLGRGELPKSIEKYKNKIVLKNNLNFIDFHKEFLDCYCILPLITKNYNSEYYKTKLTSSINYVKGYNLKCLIDRDLQDIYKLKNVEVFNNENDIVDGFRNTLKDYYKQEILIF